MKGRDGLAAQQGGEGGINGVWCCSTVVREGGVNGVGDWCGEGWCIWFLTEGYFDLFTTLVGCRRSYVGCIKKFSWFRWELSLKFIGPSR